MKKFQVGTMMLAAALATGACSKGDDSANVTSNETIAGDDNGTGALDDNAIADDLGNVSDNASDNAAPPPANSN